MDFAPIASLLAGALSILLGTVATWEPIQRLTDRILNRSRIASGKSYSEKLAELTVSLTDASQQVDEILVELSAVAHEKEQAALKLAADLAELEGRESELKERISTLENMPLPAVEHFARIIGTGEKRNARRDYILFGAGVFVSTLITIVLGVFGLG